jgi:GT2 family glycosyltransferase
MTSKIKRKVPISVVIPSYCPKEDLFHCLDSVSDQSLDIPYEVIVVDSSPDDPAPKINKMFPDVQVFHLKERTLSGRARSIGAAKAMGDVIFFTDTDCVVDRDWLKQLWLNHQSGYLVAGGSVVNGTQDSYVGTTEYLLEFNEMNPWVKAGEVRALPSCNLAVNKKIFQSVGYFPDFLKGEDTIFCENVISSGEKIFFNPEAKIAHTNRKQFAKYVRNQVALGEGSVEARRWTKRPGHFLIRWPFLLPLVPVYRTLVIGKRFLASRPGLFLSYLYHYPLIFIGLIAHTWGFIRGPYRTGFTTEVKTKDI